MYGVCGEMPHRFHKIQKIDFPLLAEGFLLQGGTMKRILLMSVLIISFSCAYAADSLQTMFSEGTARGEIRVLDFSRDFDGSTDTRRDDAVGGLFYFKTAPLYGISFGLGFATVNDMFSDEDDAVYGILKKGDDGDHESMTRLQEAYIQGEWFKTTVKYGAQEISTPFLDRHDLRMIPRSYKGLSVVNNSVSGLTASAYYITDSMGWTDDDFISMSDAVAAEPGGASSIDDEKPMIIGGLSYVLPVQSFKSTAQGWFYTMPDVFRETYFKVSLSKTFGDFTLFSAPSLLYQKSQGDELNGELDTDQVGLNAGVSAYGVTFTGFYAKTGDDTLLAPWGDDKAIIQQVLAAGRAEEDAYAAKLAYDFTKVGVKGLSAYVFYGQYDVPASTGKDMSETDYNIQYAFSGKLDGIGLRARYASIEIDGGEDYTDTRFYVTYKFAFNGK